MQCECCNKVTNKCLGSLRTEQPTWPHTLRSQERLQRGAEVWVRKTVGSVQAEEGVGHSRYGEQLEFERAHDWGDFGIRSWLDYSGFGTSEGCSDFPEPSGSHLQMQSIHCTTQLWKWGELGIMCRASGHDVGSFVARSNFHHFDYYLIWAGLSFSSPLTHPV